MPYLNLQQLRLRDYRCFEAIDIDFHPKLTVLVAANGGGKTAILDAIAVAFGPYIGAFDEAVGKHFESSDIRQFRVRETATNEMEYAAQGVRLEASGCIPGSNTSLTTWGRSLSSPTKAKTTIRDSKKLIDYGKRLQAAVRTPGKDVLLPLIAYYGTGRLWQQKKRTEAKGIQHTSRTIGYADCVDPASSYKSFVEWFRYWNLNAKDLQFKNQTLSPAYQEFIDYIASVTGAVDTCLAPVGWKGVEYSFRLDHLVAHHDQYGELPVALLSDGIRNMIGMVADIAFRATKLNGQLGAKAATQTPGIVLIDEIDMHLHPQWQQIVLQSQTQAFPQMQFIVTTHSPQVLSSVRRENIRVIFRDAEGKWQARSPDQEIMGMESSMALNEVMGVNPIPPVGEAQLIADYTAAIENNLHGTPEGMALRERLIAIYGNDHPVIRDADRLIRFQGFKLRQKSKTEGQG